MNKQIKTAWMKSYLSVLTLICTLLGVASLVPAAFAIMVFDAPGSETNPATIALFCVLFFFPAVCFVSIPLAKSLYCSVVLRDFLWRSIHRLILQSP